tara:strand:+ start:1293 stop:2588 length:1296 start_codon:yes stop_codon:yes gene_type:complete
MAKSLNIHRRRFVKQLGGAAVALPFYDILLGGKLANAACIDGRANRAIFLYHPDGIPEKTYNGSENAGIWHPQATSNLSFGRCTSAFNSVADKVCWMQNLSYDPNRGGGGHRSGAQMALTGKRPDSGTASSINTLLAENIYPADYNGLRHIHLGVGSSGPIEGTTTWQQSNELSGLDNPVAAWNNIFGNLTPNTGQSGSGEKSIIDANIQEVMQLRNSLGQAERSKLDIHLEQLRNLEAQLSFQVGDCDFIAKPPQVDISDKRQFEAIIRQQLDIIFNALSCNLARVATFELGYPQWQGAWDLPGSENHHTLSHPGTGDVYQNYKEWEMQQFAYLIDKLANTAEPGCSDGSMLDYTVIYVFSEVGFANEHAWQDVGHFIVGSGGGFFNTNSKIDVGHAHPGQAQISIAQAMGLTNWNGLGDVSGALHAIHA